GIEEAGFVVVGVCGQEGITGGEVEEGFVALEFFVAEETEGSVAGSVTLDKGSNMAAVGLTLELEALAGCDLRAIIAHGVIESAKFKVDGGEAVLKDLFEVHNGGQLIAPVLCLVQRIYLVEVHVCGGPVGGKGQATRDEGFGYFGVIEAID